MTIISYVLWAAGAFLATWLGTRAMRQHAPSLGLVQVPNARSSHISPTPQGGGVAIAAVSIAGIGLACLTDAGLVPVVGLTAAIAILGLADDILDLSPALRFPVQGIVMAALLAWAQPLPDLVLPFGLQVNGWLLLMLLWLGALWWVNLFNFMDGIDGIAATQAIIIVLGGLLIACSVDRSFLTTPMAFLVLIIASATAGFLVLNWAPARIFMGDAGSNTLAVLILTFALATVGTGSIGYAPWLILLSPFAADTTVALVRRSARGERPWKAHRRHAYQQLSRRFGHARVTATYSAFALAVVPIALLAQHNPASAWLLVGLVYALLTVFVWRAGSGHESESAR